MLTLGPYKINTSDKLKTGFRAKYNLLLDKIIKDIQLSEGVLTLITHDGSTLECDLTDGFYTKDEINDLFIISLATEEEAGIIRIGTMDEVMDGNLDNVAITPYKLYMYMAYQSARVFKASVDMPIGTFVTIYLDEDTNELMVKPALADSFANIADGFLYEDAEEGLEAFVKLSGEICEAYFDGDTNTGYLVPHERYYLTDDPDAFIQLTTIAPTAPGSVKQPLGYAISDREIKVDIDTPELNWTPVFEGLPDLYYSVGSEQTKTLLLTDYVAEYIDPDTLAYKTKERPEWVSSQAVVFGELSITGTPVKEGSYPFLLDITGVDGRTYTQVINLIVLPAPKATFNLQDDTAAFAGKLIPGAPNTYNYTDPWGLEAVVQGSHDAIKWRVRGGNGTVDVSSGVDPVPVTGSVHSVLSGVSYPAGIYNWDFATYKDVGEGVLLETYSDTVVFNLFDPSQPENPDQRVKIELLDTATPANLGEVGQVATVHETPDSIDLRFSPRGIVYDELRVTLFPEVEPFTNTFYPTITDVTPTLSAGQVFTDTGAGSVLSGYTKTDFLAVSPGQKIWYKGTTTDNTGISGYSSASASSFVIGLLDSAGGGDVVHNKAEIIIPTGVTHIRASSKSNAPVLELVTENNYLMFNSTVAKESGDYTVFVRAYLSGVQVYEKFGQFTLLEAPPEEIIPVAGLQYVADPSINVPIPLTGGVLTLPVSGGFKLISNLTGVEYDGIQVASYEFSSTGVWTTIDLPMQLGFSPNKTFTTPRQSGTFQVFGGKSSLDVPGIHVVSSFHRVELTYTLAGETVAIVNGEWQFNPTAGLPDPTEPEPGEFILYWTEYEDF